MSSEGENLTREIVIVRRRKGGGEEGHHGGAWKIAYADFMTAMMAFFLVMWLVNMTDDKTIAQIANYFNPIQLTDRSPTNKGVRDSDPKSQQGHADETDDQSQVPQKSSSSPGKARMERARQEKAAAEEAKMFIDPMKTLEEAASLEETDLAPQQGARDKLAGLDEEGLRKENQQAGPDLFDPFDPRIEGSVPNSQPVEKVEDLATTQSAQGKTTQPLPSEVPTDIPASQSPTATPQEVEATDRSKDGSVPADGQEVNQKEKQQAADVERLLKAVRASERQLQDAQLSVAVEATPEGLLVTIMENEQVEMFRRGSAEPLPATVALVERISAVLKSEKGPIVIRGHTDAAQYRTAGYDNWRLSTARAHMAHYMLRRGGIPDERIQKIEGFADKNLRNKQKPLNPENRRIELLLQIPSP